MSKIIGHINVPKMRPALEDLVITPTTVDQNFKSNRDGYENVRVNAIHGDDLTVTPTLEEQNYNGLYENIKIEGITRNTLNVTPSAEAQTHRGVYTEVTVDGESNLKPENIKKDETVFGVTGTMVSMNGENIRVDTSTPYKQNELQKLVTIISDLNISSFTSGDGLFHGNNWPKLEKVGKLNTSHMTNMSNMFYGCSNLKSVEKFDTSKVTNMSSMFDNCASLTDVPQFDTSNVTKFNSMFSWCSSLTDVPLLDTSKATEMAGVFYSCTALKTVPQFDTSKATTIMNMFRDCSSLTDVPELDASSVTYVSGWMGTSFVFENCYSLTNFGGFKDLGKGFAGLESAYYALNVTFNTMLTYESLLNILNKLYDLTSHSKPTATQFIQLGATNLAKLRATEEGQQAIANAQAKGWGIQ